MPAGQPVQVVVPVIGEYIPAMQLIQVALLVAPAVLLAVPKGQPVHVLDMALDHVPATHVVHVAELMAEKVPALQLVHAVEPDGEYVPA